MSDTQTGLILWHIFDLGWLWNVESGEDDQDIETEIGRGSGSVGRSSSSMRKSNWGLEWPAMSGQKSPPGVARWHQEKETGGLLECRGILSRNLTCSKRARLGARTFRRGRDGRKTPLTDKLYLWKKSLCCWILNLTICNYIQYYCINQNQLVDRFDTIIRHCIPRAGKGKENPHFRLPRLLGLQGLGRPTPRREVGIGKPIDLTVSRLPELVSRLQQKCIECKVKSHLSVLRSTHLLELLC